jgi:uncharacterized protein YndB with AHSA1/START domain
MDAEERLDNTLQDKKDGHNVESILKFDKEKVPGKPEMKAISTLIGGAILESQEHKEYK